MDPSQDEEGPGARNPPHVFAIVLVGQGEISLGGIQIPLDLGDAGELGEAVDLSVDPADLSRNLESRLQGFLGGPQFALATKGSSAPEMESARESLRPELIGQSEPELGLFERGVAMTITAAAAARSEGSAIAFARRPRAISSAHSGRSWRSPKAVSRPSISSASVALDGFEAVIGATIGSTLRGMGRPRPEEGGKPFPLL